ncbi:MAG TPA: FAD-dependent oxidoreductase [Smithellaceae bacterium]|nr:FAD-dependent oxidoreductase [Syntrophaceae bacterium]MDX9816787.1 FAD-dependent oxidoreductase [Smithellaceae bacterium]NMD04989.1 FAD-dependent oxidoreductase [Deltaproteobacteria bacterium]MBP8607903.1 FAD-dependent oxidoreductase [Syntrophaceae bacterium]HNQ18703.1 FAD-dependent oxidoreductase [Smithellaceae bacterium]
MIKDDKKLIARTPEKFRENGIDVWLNTEVVNVNYERNTVEISTLKNLPFDFLVMATGTKAMMPDIPGIDSPGVFVLKNLENALQIKSYMRKNNCRKAIIIGAGFIAMEISEALHLTGVKTTIFHRGNLPANRWDAELSKEMLAELTANGVEFVPRAETSTVEKGNDSPLKAITNQGTWNADMIIVATGVKPNVELAQSINLKIGSSGAIAVNHFQQTSKENVYAAGDCCESYHRVTGRWVNIPLGDIANKQGRVVGRNVGGRPLTFDGIVGAQSFRLFNLECAATGISEKEAAENGYNPVSVLVWGSAMAKTMGQKKIGLKMIADKSSGKFLGAQAVGEAGVIGRINALSVALWTGLNIDEIGYLDLAYSPPYGGAWDIIHNTAQALRRSI